MENNNIVTAPQIADVQSVYEFWRRNHTGSLSAFYKFMTTPTAEREEFVALLGARTDFNGSVVSVTLNTPTR